MTIKVLVSDKLSEESVKIFKDRGIDVDYQPEIGKDKERLAQIIGNYDGLAIRSATKVTENILKNANKLKVIGRAGIGVDNVDIAASTSSGVIVMNTPFGNSVTTAEHAITLMMALARQIPQADHSTKSSLWEKSKFMGVEITSKTLGVIGCGNIGSIVIDRAKGLKMKVIGFDPYLTESRADTLGIEKVELNEIFKRSDFITIHTPLTDKTKNIINSEAIKKMKPSVRIINCARGGLIDEKALTKALKENKISGAAIDVFEEEPAKNNPLFDIKNVICTPHLGASTLEAQEKVAIQIAEQMSDFLLTGAITNAINFPSVSAEDASSMEPYLLLAKNLGSFAGQITETAIQNIVIEYSGDIANMNIETLTSTIVCSLLKPLLEDINMVNSLIIAKERGIKIEQIKTDSHGVYGSYIKVAVDTERQHRSLAGTVFSDRSARIIQIKDIDMEAKFGSYMIYITNNDKPGLVGKIGECLGSQGVNIANFNLGRDKIGGNVIELIEVDTPINDRVLKKLSDIDGIVQVKKLNF
jgi:D-3-phosphoglycerate dehydrogenase / 2-oxoglutarate reductase